MNKKSSRRTQNITKMSIVTNYKNYKPPDDAFFLAARSCKALLFGLVAATTDAASILILAFFSIRAGTNSSVALRLARFVVVVSSFISSSSESESSESAMSAQLFVRMPRFDLVDVDCCDVAASSGKASGAVKGPSLSHK